MAKNDDTSRTTSHTHRRTAGDRERRRDMVVNTVKERPYTAAALATVAAGAAAFFLTRGKSDKPLMNWGQETQGDHVKGAGAFKAGADTSSKTGETSTSPSAAQAANLAASGTSTNAAASGGTGASTSPAAARSAASDTSGKTGDSALDQTAKTDTKVGAISYGA